MKMKMKILSGRLFKIIFFGCILIPIRMSSGQESSRGTRPTPLTRPELKQLIEDVKVRVPRIPLPELTDQDREKLGDQVDSYESRVRYHYLNGIEPSRSPALPQPAAPATGARSGQPAVTSREQDPAYTLDNAFKIELFWIVSRVNNCNTALVIRSPNCLEQAARKTKLRRLMAIGRSWNLPSNWLSLLLASSPTNRTYSTTTTSLA